MTPPKPQCLFIAPLKDDDSATRVRSEDVFSSLVTPAAQQAGYSPEFIFEDEPGIIINHIVRRIKAARVLVADLTGNNFSVGYEFAFAHMIRKQTIPIIKLGSRVPYDVQTLRAIEYDYTNRAALRRSIPQLAEQLKRLKKALPITTDNPLQNALKTLEPSPLPSVSPPQVRDVLPPVPRLDPSELPRAVPSSTFSERLIGLIEPKKLDLRQRLLSEFLLKPPGCR